MRQYVLAAGFDYLFTGVSFRTLADNRRRRLTLANAKREDLRFTVIDFAAGAIVVTDVSYPGGNKTEAVTAKTKFAPIGTGNYEPRTSRDGNRHNVFKADQFGTASILDVYDLIRAIGATDSGTLAELSIFSHGHIWGPILVNSMDERNPTLPVPSVDPAPATAAFSLAGTTLRNPGDRDGRAVYDFVAPTMDSKARETFRAAFMSDAIIWLWGCSYPTDVHHMLTAMEMSPDYSSTSMGGDSDIRLTGLSADGRLLLRRVLGALIPPVPPQLPVTLKFKYLRHCMCVLNLASYASVIADAAQRRTYAAAVGTYTDYDKSGPNPLMNVVPIFQGRLNFYANYLGFGFDPEGRRYAAYDPGKTCPPP